METRNCRRPAKQSGRVAAELLSISATRYGPTFLQARPSLNPKSLAQSVGSPRARKASWPYMGRRMHLAEAEQVECPEIGRADLMLAHSIP